MRIGQKVQLDNTYVVHGNAVVTGIVTGTATRIQPGTNDLQQLQIVDLDHGFYNKDETIYTSSLLVSPQYLIPIE